MPATKCPAMDEVKQVELHYLGIVELVVSITTVYTVKIYEVVKELSGDWKSTLEGVEWKVKYAVGPACKYIEDKPHEVLIFLDKKVDTFVCYLRACNPHLVAEKLKGVTYAVVGWLKKIPDVLLDAALELRKSGFVGTCKVYAVKWQPVAEEWGCAAWKGLLRLPYSIEVVHVLASPSLAVACKCNEVLLVLKKHKALPFIDYVPAFPVKQLEAVIKREA